jgi:hypothetical protein
MGSQTIPGISFRQQRLPVSAFTITEPAGLSNSAAIPYLLGGHIRNPNQLDADASNDTIEYNWGYGDMNPVMPPYLDNYVRPRDPFTVGYHRLQTVDTREAGTRLISRGRSTPKATPNLQQFHFIRLTAFVDRNTGILGYVSPEIDGVVMSLQWWMMTAMVFSMSMKRASLETDPMRRKALPATGNTSMMGQPGRRDSRELPRTMWERAWRCTPACDARIPWPKQSRQISPSRPLS